MYREKLEFNSKIGILETTERNNFQYFALRCLYLVYLHRVLEKNSFVVYNLHMNIGTEKVLTIVIPSYNTEKFIDKNIKTFINETVFGLLEVLIVNDGSKDDTKTKALEYEKLYPDFIKVIDKENGGHGSTINTGLKYAVGKYFKVVDGDDWVDTGNLVRLVNDLKKVDSDIVINDYYQISERSGSVFYQEMSKELTEKQYNLKDIISPKKFSNTIHSITYKTELLKKNNVKLSEKCFYEDFEYTYFPTFFAKTISFFKYPVYYYLIDQKTQSVADASILKNIDMFIRVLEDSLSFIGKIDFNILPTEFLSYSRESLSVFIRSIYNVFLRNYKEKNIFEKFQNYNIKMQKLSEDMVSYVLNGNAYIRMALKSYLMFKIIGLCLRIYKRMIK